MAYDTSVMEKSLEFIKKGAELIKDNEAYKSDYEFLANHAEANAKAAMEITDSSEKASRVNGSGITWARQLAFILFDEGLMTDELEAEYRAIGNYHQVVDAVKQFNDEREARATEHYDIIQDINKEKGELDVFMAVLRGMSKEEAEKKVAEQQG